MGKRIIIPFTPFATLQWWAVILLPPSGAYPCCILSPRALPGAGISMPLRGVTNTHPQPLPKGGEIEAYTNSDRRTKEHNTPSLREGWGGLHITPNPYQREGSVDGWGKYGLRSSLLAFKTKWRKKGQKQVSPRQRLGNCSQPTFAQNGQKNYYSVHSLCHSAVVGCYSFAPFGGVSMLHPLPPGVARGWHINAPSGRN